MGSRTGEPVNPRDRLRALAGPAPTSERVPALVPSILPAPTPAPAVADWNVATASTSPFERHEKAIAPGNSEDLSRVVALPRRPPLDLENDNPQVAALVSIMTERLRRPNASCKCAPAACITTLKPAQAWALWEAPLAGGLLGPIGVGHGKTGLDILLPMVMPKCQVAVLLIPPNLQDQLLRMYDLWAEHFRVPSLIIGKMGKVVPGAPRLHVVPYSSFSRAQSSDLLERIKPDLIISDEAQKLRHRVTATTSRVLRYFAAHPETRLACYSGTLTAKSIRDYAHLSALALRKGSPLPTHPQTVEEWSVAVDPPQGTQMFRAAKGALVKLCDPPLEDIYSAFRRRLTDTLGVTATKAGAVEAGIVISERKPPPVPEVLADLIAGVRLAWTRPDGEEFVDVLQKEQCARELASGFFYRWRYPRREDPTVIDRWLAARKAWHQELRKKLVSRQEHLDSPLLCAKAAIRYYAGTDGAGEPYHGDLPVWRADTWPDWVEVRDTVQPETEAVWVDEYLAKDAASWATSERGIVWYEHEAFGRKVAELSGLPMHGGGPKAGELIAAEDGSRSIVASIKSHGTGRDGLQRLFATQLVANPPSSAEQWEQLMGRTHRPGQKSESVSFLVYRHTDEMADAIDRALEFAKYIQGTTGSLQKLLSADVEWSLRGGK